MKSPIGAALLVAAVCAGLALVGAALFLPGAGLDPKMGFHGFFALGIGVVVSVLLGVGLMTLVFFSARQGYDDRADIERDEDPKT